MTEEEITPEQEQAIKEYERARTIISDTVNNSKTHKVEAIVAAATIIIAAELNSLYHKLPKFEVMEFGATGMPPGGYQETS